MFPMFNIQLLRVIVVVIVGHVVPFEVRVFLVVFFFFFERVFGCVVAYIFRHCFSSSTTVSGIGVHEYHL